jgi:polar amino acid transport system permease protein
MQNLGISVLFEGKNFIRLLEGLLVTLEIAILAIITALILGVLFGIIRTTSNKLIKIIFKLYLELFRIIPILVWLFAIYYLFPTNLNIELSAETVAYIVFALWGAAEMSDIVRGAIISLPKHQMESSKALGLTFVQTYRYILLPQATKRAIPPVINLITRMIKTTALLTMIGVVEVIKIGQQIIQVNNSEHSDISFWIYGIIFCMYFCICFPLSHVSRKLETKWAS